jgi:hypothetical protein
VLIIWQFTYSPLLSQWMADILPDRDGKTIPIVRAPQQSHQQR